MKTIFSLSAFFLFTFYPVRAQNNNFTRIIDSLLIQEEYKKVIDTCSKILVFDSLNPVIYYKMGIAWQNLLEDKKATESYLRAAEIDTANQVYSFKLAKGYFSAEKYKLAEPLLEKLCKKDPMNWIYAYYLTSIYMQSERYDEAYSIYISFLQSDPSNCVYLDKTAFVCLRKGDFMNAIDIFNRSLAINSKNLPAIKNLSYLYASTSRWDTAVVLLTNGIKTDSTDMDLYVRRAQLYYSKNYTKRALDDYLVILASGDSSKLYLKRAGIGYSYNLQPKQAIVYLLKAYKSDSTDYETCSFLGQCYNRVNDMKNSVSYYKKAIKILFPLNIQLGYTYSLCAESQKSNGSNKDAIDSYLKAYAIDKEPGTLLSIANIYDEKLSDKENAINYYKSFLDKVNSSKMNFTPEYVLNVKKRMEYLKTDPVR